MSPKKSKQGASISEFSEALATILDPMRPFVERSSTIRYPLRRLFSSCLRASFVKTFEFVDFAAKQQSDNAFFFAPVLRGVTEDVIFFRFLSRFPHKHRQQVVSNLMAATVHKKLEEQGSFFHKFRPFQPVLSKHNIDDQRASDDLRLFWQANGWPSLKHYIPPVREMAEKSDPGILEVVYDFIYRLTSGVVHFNPQVLLRSGWGNVPISTTFSSRNMGPYYLALSQVYGSYLLCLYFELFGRYLRPNNEEKSAVEELRRHLLLILRWPEMVTFEEMNVAVPKPPMWPNLLFYGINVSIMEKGFISGAQKLLAKETRQTRSTTKPSKK